MEDSNPPIEDPRESSIPATTIPADRVDEARRIEEWSDNSDAAWRADSLARAGYREGYRQGRADERR